MSSGFEQAQSEWLAKLAAMRQAISDLKLDNADPRKDRQLYGDDLGLNQADFAAVGSDVDVWDLSDDDEDDDAYSEPSSAGHAAGPSSAYDQAWLVRKCESVALSQSGLDAGQLAAQVTAQLASDSGADELQMSLADVLGFGDLDFVADLIAHRGEVLASSAPPQPSDRARGGDVLSQLQTRAERDAELRRRDAEHKSARLLPAQARDEPQYPHVYTAFNARSLLAPGGRPYALPAGSERTDRKLYTEYRIPATEVGQLGRGQRLVEVAEMDGLCQRTFKGYKALNRMQSLVYPVAYRTSENMLICAPTGAGKTDAAMLAVLNAVAHNVHPNPLEHPDARDFALHSADFKIVYVAPMKALAAEITDKLGRRLAWLGINVREYTGDMHLTKKEILQTQVIVTTPEKWDVVTRKSTGDTELVQKVRLLIIDEVHMLHDERGAVLEALVARTQRQVESTQSLIRIVGLSATLPNYVDVAQFLKVNLYAGLFYFDASFRPVPLEQHFIGVHGKANSRQSRENIDHVAFEKVRDMLQEGHQVMVFVHSRKDTVNTARKLLTLAQDDGCAELFDCTSIDGHGNAMKELRTAKGREVKELVPKGFGTHHAGMPRTDRNRIEQLFSQGHINVLCCTATLAWGVNLPAAAVVIKGTQIYSAQEGKFVDLGILDVLQIFGRAGRPQFQATGIGFICTTDDKLDHYLSAVTQQQPIESKFSRKLVDNLNAEISLGTVTSIPEAVQWIGYSYLFVRMLRNPTVYGIEWTEKENDKQLVQRRRQLAIQAARTLQKNQMIIFNESTEELRVKDVGRIASQYYILHTSVEIFNSMMKPQATEADVLKMLSMSGEFDNIQFRDSEYQELLRLKQEGAPCDVEGFKGRTPGAPQSNEHITTKKKKGEDDKDDVKDTVTAAAKTNVLLQSYISRCRIEDFALVSDSAYVAQNSGRICRALFMIALNRGWGHQCLVLLSLCKSIEKRIWPFQHPFHQFDLPKPIMDHLDAAETTGSIESLRDMAPAEIGSLVHNHGMGKRISGLLNSFPTLTVEAEIAPLNRHVLRIKLYVTPDFNWDDRHNGTAESYWIWVENAETSEIYHHEYFLLSRKKLYDEHELNFTIPMADPLPTQIYVRAVSDRWLGAETVTPVSFQHLIRPDTESVYTDLLSLQPLPVTALKNPALEEIYGQRFQFFNPMQTQIFHTLYYTAENVLLGSPTGSGKTVAAELAMWWAFREKPKGKVVYIAPMKALVRERVLDWGKRLARPMGLKLVELTGDNTPDTRTIRDADIIVTTPEKWDGISRSWQTRGYVRQVALVIIDEIHLLGGDRGPILEIIVSRMNYIASQSKGSVRLVGMSTACANALDLANWLGVKHGLFNFRHSVRPVPLEIFIDGFPEQRGFCPLMQSMNRPTFLAIKTHSPEKPVIVFVASRRQTRLTAKDLINFCGMEDNPRRFVRMSEEDLQLNLARVKDEALREALGFGIGLHHAGLVESDRQLAEELFAHDKIQVLVATSTLAWGVNLPAHLVVVKGTQFFDAKSEGYKDMDLTDVLQMLGRAGRPQFDTSGVARIFTQDAKKAFYKHFLHTGFPVESQLHRVLDDHLGAEVSAGSISSMQDALDYLTWTFFFRRLHKNPTYYGLELAADEHNSAEAQHLANEYMVALVRGSLESLAESRCVALGGGGAVAATALGRIASFYYLSHRTVRHLAKRARRGAPFAQVLGWMAGAAEFDELPVRHNEDVVNGELARALPLGADLGGDMPLWDPHVKAFLLLQAHLSRADLPVADYTGDQTSVLDQSARVLQAAVDVLAELGPWSAAREAVRVLQAVKSARWPADNPASVLPGVPAEGPDAAAAAAPAAALSPSSPLSAVADALAANADGAAAALGVPQRQAAAFKRAAANIPRLAVSVARASAAALTVRLVRQNAAAPRDLRAYAPRFPKAQTEGYFAFAVDREADEVLALKRVGFRAAGPTGATKEAREEAAREERGRGRGGRAGMVATAELKLPAEGAAAARRVDVHVLSDVYPGMEWVVRDVEVPAAPRAEGGAEKEKV